MLMGVVSLFVILFISAYNTAEKAYNLGGYRFLHGEISVFECLECKQVLVVILIIVSYSVIRLLTGKNYTINIAIAVGRRRYNMKMRRIVDYICIIYASYYIYTQGQIGDTHELMKRLVFMCVFTVVCLITLWILGKNYKSIRYSIVGASGNKLLGIWKSKNNNGIFFIFEIIVLILFIGLVVQKTRCIYKTQQLQNEIVATRNSIMDKRSIVHAAGTIIDGEEEYIYTNSLEALENAYSNDNRFIEIDFCPTVDGDVVLSHYWLNVELGGEQTKENYLKAKVYGLFTTMDLEMLAQFMYDHEDLYIITDIKSNNVEVCAQIQERYPDLVDRFIIQIYHVNEFGPISELGYKKIIFTLYTISTEEMNIDVIADAIKKYDILAVTFWESWIYDVEDSWRHGKDFYNTMRSLGIPICVHTVNDRSDILNDFDEGVDIVYTDNVDNNY